MRRRVALALACVILTSMTLDVRGHAIVTSSARLCFVVAGSPGDAAIVNLTPVNARASGYGLLISSDVEHPPVASNVNFGLNTIDPNVAVVPIGVDGKVCYVNSFHSDVELVADHLGTIKAASYTPATPSGAPQRKVDTRIGLGGTRIAPSGRLCFAVAGSPGDAAIVNLTPVNARASGYGLLISSDVEHPPVASNVNFGLNTIDPNVAVVPIGVDGKVCYVNSFHSDVELVADHLGTIKAASYTPATPSGAPQRKVDTRIGLGGTRIAPSGRLCFAVAGSPGDAAIVNLTPVNARASGYGRLFSSDLVYLTVVSNVNFGLNTIDPNVAVAPIGVDGKVCYLNSGHTDVDLVTDHLGTIKAADSTPARPSGAPKRVVDTRIELGVPAVTVLVAHDNGAYVTASQLNITCGTYFAGLAAGQPYYAVPVRVTVTGLSPDATPDDATSNGSRLEFEIAVSDVPPQYGTSRGEVFADGAGVAQLGQVTGHVFSHTRGTITLTNSPADSQLQPGTSTFTFDVPCPPTEYS